MILGLLRSRTFHIMLGTLISVVLIAYFVQIVDWPEVVKACQDINYWYFIPVTILFVVQLILRALRWKALLPQQPAVSSMQLFDGIMIGNFGNFILPLRAGEFLRPLLLKKVAGAGFTTSFVSVIVERILDLSAVLIVFSFLLQSVESIPDWLEFANYVLGIIAIGLCSGVVISALLPQSISWISGKLQGILPGLLSKLVAKLTRDVLKGTKVLKHPGHLFGALLGTALVWLCTYAQMYYSFRIFNIEAEFWHAMTISIVIGLAIAAPSAPGFLGVFQVACLAAFSICGFDKSTGAAFALIIHLHQYIIIVLAGVLISFKHGMRISDLSKKSRDVAESSLESECAA